MLDVLEVFGDEAWGQPTHEPVVRVEPAVRLFHHDAHELDTQVDGSHIGQSAERPEQKARRHPLRIVDGAAKRDLGAAVPAEDTEPMGAETGGGRSALSSEAGEDSARILQFFGLGHLEIELGDPVVHRKRIPYAVPERPAPRDAMRTSNMSGAFSASLTAMSTSPARTICRSVLMS